MRSWKKRAKNYISISAGGAGKMFTYFARIGLLLKTSRRYKLQPVILVQINLNWNKKQNFHFQSVLRFATLQSRPKDAFKSLSWTLLDPVSFNSLFCNANSATRAK